MGAPRVQLLDELVLKDELGTLPAEDRFCYDLIGPAQVLRNLSMSISFFPLCRLSGDLHGSRLQGEFARRFAGIELLESSPRASITSAKVTSVARWCWLAPNDSTHGGLTRDASPDGTFVRLLRYVVNQAFSQSRRSFINQSVAQANFGSAGIARERC